MPELSAADIAGGRRLLASTGPAGAEWVWAHLPALLDAAEKVAAIPKLGEGDRYRYVSPDDGLGFELTILRRVDRWGGPELGLQRVPMPVAGSVWVAEVVDEKLGVYRVLCTSEGLQQRGFEQIEETDDVQ